MDLALGIAYSGYHLWRHGQKPRIDIDHPYLLNIPAEIRLIIYDLVFDDPEETLSPSQFLRPLLVCRLIHHEAFPLAFERANFVLCVNVLKGGPFWSPQILTLPFSKMSRVRKAVVLWDGNYLDKTDLRRFFSELEHGPLKLTRLVFKIRNQHCRNLFTDKYATLYGDVANFGNLVMEELPVLENVRTIVFSPGVAHKSVFQLLFDPGKPKMVVERVGGSQRVHRVNKKLGLWKYTVLRDLHVWDWRIELTHSGEG